MAAILNYTHKTSLGSFLATPFIISDVPESHWSWICFNYVVESDINVLFDLEISAAIILATMHRLTKGYFWPYHMSVVPENPKTHSRKLQ